MRALSTAAAAALSASPLPLAVLVEMDLDAPLFLNTGGVDLTLDGATYYGTKGLGSIGAVRETPAEVAQMQFELAGVNTELIATALGSQVQGRAVRLKVAIFDPATYQVLDARLRWAGVLEGFHAATGARVLPWNQEAEMSVVGGILLHPVAFVQVADVVQPEDFYHPAHTAIFDAMLQLDGELVDALHERGFEIGGESNGTIAATPGIDWLCISPKAGSETIQRSGDELKLVWPQPGSDWEAMQDWAFDHLLVQPMDSIARAENLQASIAFVMAHPRWRLSLQTHKALGLP